MSALSGTPDPLRIASALSPALFALGDPDRFVELLNSNPAGVVLVEAGPDLPVVYCNDAFQRRVPFGRRSVLGRSLPDLFAWSDRAPIRRAYRQVIRTGLPVHWRSAPDRDPYGGDAGDGLAYWNVSHYPLRGPAGRVTHVLSFMVDVTDREREAASLRQQIAQSIELEQLKADFLKLASHELRGPLGVVRGYISMMEDGTLAPVGERVGPVLPLLRAKLDEMNQLINEMLETARLEDSALELRLARLDLRAVVRDSVRSLEPLAGQGHRLVTEAPDGPVEVAGDRSRLTMIVTNLVHNALKYSPAGGEVRVVCTCAGGRAAVTVRDEGVGIAPEDMGRLFVRFGRIVTPETTGIGGVGLGLYLARDLARRHGGDVEVASKPGCGSTFTLTLPLAAG